MPQADTGTSIAGRKTGRTVRGLLLLVRKRSRMEAGVRFLGGGDWWKGWREEDGPGMQGHDYWLSGPRTVNMKTVRGKELCSLLLDSQVKVSSRPKDPWFWS